MKTTKLAEYKKPTFQTIHHEMNFILRDNFVKVIHAQKIKRLEAGIEDLVLDGEKLNLEEVSLNGRILGDDEYLYIGDALTVFKVPDEFILKTITTLRPDDNKELSGLYRSNGIFCTQCEAEGFRRISFAIDRPDVLSTFKIRIEGDIENQPVLLSNGNLVEEGKLGDNRHFAIWNDPFPKPTYLFALVAGNLAEIKRSITTESTKQIDLRIYTEPEFIDQANFAMQSIIEAINWDEQRFNLKYDLNRFNIVAISDFNMGAMENKSLNIFNTKYIFADTATATDADFHAIQSVIGHEYFHNWTGNRITCRDWFQLSLKEGLTVFRDQEFSADMNEPELERIKNVNVLRRVQFAEDKSPMAHPVQPQEYAAIDNFYTATVYEKGAEIIRMYKTILGEEKFQKGMALYIRRFDGQAAKIEDFALCMQEAGNYPFCQDFFNWYLTAGTPKVSFKKEFVNGRLTLKAKQDISAVNPKTALVIPVRLAFIKEDGSIYNFENGRIDYLWILEREYSEISFDIDDERWIPALLLGFSAPIYYEYDYKFSDLRALANFAPDAFVRFEAMQNAYKQVFTSALENSANLPADAERLANIMRQIMHDDRSFAEKAEILKFPALASFLPYLKEPLDITKITEVYEQIRGFLTIKLRMDWQVLLNRMPEPNSPQFSPINAGIRALRAVALEALAIFADKNQRSKFLDLYFGAQNMTERMAALNAINETNDALRDEALAEFHERFSDQPLVIDKWFALQATDKSDGALARIQKLAARNDYSITNPNRFRSLISSFTQNNLPIFHQEDGGGYHFVRKQIERIISDNPQLAARLLASSFSLADKLDENRQKIIKRELLSLKTIPNLSLEVIEILDKLIS